MADLNLQITASSKEAKKSIDNLVVSLKNLGSALSAIKSNNIATSFDAISQSLSKFNTELGSIDTEKLKTLSNSLKGIASASKGLVTASNGISNIGKQEDAATVTTKKLAEEITRGFSASKTQVQEIEKALRQVVDANGSINWDKWINGKGIFESIANSIRNNISVLTGYESEYRRVRDHIKGTSGKVELPFNGNAEFSDDYRSMRSVLGKQFGMNNGGMDFNTFVQQMNDTIGTTVPVANSAAETFENLANHLRKLKDASNGVAGSTAFQGQKGLNDVGQMAINAAESVDKEQQAIQRLNQTTQQVPQQTGLTYLTEELKKLQGLNFTGGEQLTKLVEGISKLGSKNVEKAAQNLPKLTEALTQMLNKLSKAPQVSENTIRMTQAMGQLSSHSVNLNQQLPKVGNNLKGLLPHAKSAKNGFTGLAAAFGKFYASCFLLIRGIKGLWSSIKESMGTIETFNYYNKTLQTVTKTATEADWSARGVSDADAYYESFVKETKALTTKMSGYIFDENGSLLSSGMNNLGLDPNLVMNYQAQFAQMASSMGATSENAYKLSDALVKISADVASLKNKEFSEVMDNFSSVLVGMSRAGDKYGINVRVAAMDQKLMELGIDTTTKKLNAEQKALLRTIIILDASRGAWGDLSDTLDQPTNQLRMLEAGWKNLCRTIGGLFTSTVASILPYINSLVKALQYLFEWLTKALGVQFVSSSKEATNDLGLLNDQIYGTGEALDDASDSAKKLKNNLLGIDELNVISDSSGSGDNGGGGYNGDDLQNAFDDILNEYNSVWEEAFNNLNSDVQRFTEEIIKAFEKGDYTAIGQTIANAIKNALNKIDWDSIFAFQDKWGKGWAEFFNGFNDPEMFYKVGETIANGINAVFHSVCAFVSNYDWKRAGLSLASLVNGFVDTIDVTLIANTVSTAIKGAFDLAITFMQNTKWREIGEKIGQFLAELDWVGILKKVAQAILTALSACLATLSGLFDANPFAGAIVTVLASAFTISKLTTVATAITTALGGTKLISGLTGLGASAGTALTTGMTTSVASAEAGMTGLGLTAGGWIVAGITAAVGGFSLGEYIYTAWGGDEKDLLSNNVGVISDYVANNASDYWYQAGQTATANWASGVKSITFDTGIFDPSVGVLLDGDIDKLAQIDAGLKRIGESDYFGYDNGFTTNSEQFEKWLGNVKDIDSATKEYLITLSQGYSQLDENARAYLEYKYGIEATTGGIVQNEAALKQAVSTQVGYYNALQQSREAELKHQQAMEQTKAITEKAKSSFSALPSEMQKCIEKYEQSTGKTSAYREEINKNIEAHRLQEERLKAEQDRWASFVEEQNKAAEKSREFNTETTNLNVTMETVTGQIDTFNASIQSVSETTLPVLNEQMSGFTEVVDSASDNFDGFNETVDKLNENIIKSAPDVQKAFEDTINSAVTGIQSALDWYDETVAPRFTLEHWTDVLSSIPSAFDSAFASVQSIVANRMNRLIDAINDAVSEIKWDSIEIDGEQVAPGGSAKLFHIDRIEGFATGGFPTPGNLFMANENGAEMIGSINNRTAVVNNDQIVNAVSQGVSVAVGEAMIPYLSQIANNTRETASKDFSVNIGDRDIARANARGQRSMGRSIISTI